MKRLLVLALVCLAVISCKKDDDSSDSNQSNLNGSWYFVSWKEVDGWNQNMQNESGYENILSNCDLNSYAVINNNKLELKAFSDYCSEDCPLSWEFDYIISINDSTINFTEDVFTDLINCNNSNPNSDSYDVWFSTYEESRYIKSGNTLKLFYNNSDGPQDLWTDVITLEKN